MEAKALGPASTEPAATPDSNTILIDPPRARLRASALRVSAPEPSSPHHVLEGCQPYDSLDLPRRRLPEFRLFVAPRAFAAGRTPTIRCWMSSPLSGGVTSAPAAVAKKDCTR